MLQQVVSFALLTAMAAAAPPASSQGIGQNMSISGRTVVAPPTNIMVANAWFTSRNPNDANEVKADSTAAVVIANGIRDRLDRLVGGDYKVVPRLDMNKELERAGYNPDAILTSNAARALAGQLNVKILLTGTLSKNSAGQYVLTVRITGVNGSIADVGHMVSQVQTAGQPLPDFGMKTGELMKPVVLAYVDAKSCIDNQTDPKKGPDGAAKAIKVVPNFGLAEYCMAQIAQRTDSVSPVALAHYQNAVKGDSLSLTIWSEIALIHYKKKDSVAVIADYQQMLRVAPSNEKLADEAYKQFLRYHRPDAAEQVVAEQLKIDPANPVWYDLRSNNCLAKSDFDCAIKALEQVFTLDSTRADLAFFQKMVTAAKYKPDTARYYEWSRRGAHKFGSDVEMLADFAKSAAMAGQDDTALLAGRGLMIVDPTQTTPALFAVQQALAHQKYDAVLKLLPDFKKSTEGDAKDQFAGLLLNAANTEYSAQAKKDSTQVKSWDLTIKLSQSVIDVGAPKADLAVTANFFLGFSYVNQAIPLSTPMRAQKSCDMAKQELAFIDKAVPSLTISQTSPTQQIADLSKQYLGIMAKEKEQIEGPIFKAFSCT